MNLVEILITAKDLTGSAFASTNRKVSSTERSMQRLKATAGLTAGALAVIGYEAVKMASKFDAEMTLLVTQAGVAKNQMGVLKKGVLDLAGKVGQDPDSLAEALFHVESNFESMGISSKKALALTETAAKGATLGHADLVDVTNALTAAVAAGIPGVKNFDQAMGVLNATVGVGDMKMQDLARAFSTGMLATVKGFGLSIQDVGAALAVLGDNNIRGSLAGNQLRMSVQALGKPVSTAGDQLKRLGLTTGTLAADMRKGGLKLALEDLIDRFKKAGITGKEQGQVITDIFGRKAGAGLNILVDQFGRLESKYPKLNEGAHKFGDAWKETQKTFAFQMKALQGDFDSMMIRLGEKLIPVVQKFVDFLKGPFADAVGPVASEAFHMLEAEGGAAMAVLSKGLKVATPFLKDLAAGMQAAMEVVAPFAKAFMRAGAAIADAVVPSTKLNEMEGPLTRLRDAIRANKGAIEEAAQGMANGILDMAEVAIQNLPIVTKMFHLLSAGVLDSIGVLVEGTAKAFGGLPVIGGKLKAAAKDFDEFKSSFLAGTASADRAAASFARTAVPKLERNRLKLNISEWQDQIAAAKARLKSVPASKQAALKAQIADLQAKVDAAKAKLASIKDKSASIKARDQASGRISLIQRMLASLRDRTVTVTTNTVHTFTSVNKTAKVPVAHRDYASGGLVRGYAAGGGIQAFPDGGYVQGPGTGTSDSILGFMGSGAVAAVSNTEYVVKAAAVRKYGVKMLDAINEGRLQVAGFARGGHLTKAQQRARALAQAEAQPRRELSSEFGISTFGRMAGYKRTPFEKSLGAPADLSSLVSSLNDAAGKIKAAFHGRAESNLLRHLNSVGKSLINHEKALSKVTASLDKAKDKLNSLKDASAQLRDSVKSNLISSATITKAAGGAEGGTLTLSAVKSGMVASRDKVVAFANALKALRAKGFSKSIIQQVAEAGIDGGGLETAGALLQASASEVQTINATQGQIERAAGSAGKTTADTVYAKAIKEQAKVVDRLTKQQQKLEKAMASLAKSMEKLISKALHGKASGGIVGAAASGGLRSSLTWVGEQGPELLDLPAGARVWSNPDSRRKLAAAQAPWASMLTAPRRMAAAGVPAMSGPAEASQPIVIRLQLGRQEFEEIWVDVGRRAVQTRGSIEATLRPPRGR